MKIYREILENIKLAVILYSETLEPVYFNQSAIDLFPDISKNGIQTVKQILDTCRESISQAEIEDSSIIENGAKEYTTTLEIGGLDYTLRVNRHHCSEPGSEKNTLLIIEDITEYEIIKSDLEDSMKRFDEVAENSQVFIWEVDNDGLYVYANPVVEQLLGLPPSEMVGKKYFYDFFDPETKDAMKEAAFNTFRRKEAFSNFVNINVRSDGRKVWLKTSGVPVYDETGTMIGYRGSDMDITASVKFEEALVKSHEKYRMLFEGAAEGIVMIDLDEMDIAHCNDAFCKIFNYPYKVAISKRIQNFHPKELWDTIYLNYSTITEEQKKFIPDVPCIKSDGTIFYSNISLYLMAVNNKNYFVCFFTDVTDMRYLKEELGKLAMAVEQSANMIAITDGTGTIQMVNKAFSRITGYSKNEAIGMNMSILKSGHQTGFFYSNMWDTITNDGIWAGKMMNKKKDGSLYWDRSVITPIKNENGEITNFISIKEDITELIQFEAEKESLLHEMEIKNKELETLSYGISHDMKAPLVTIEGYCTHLQEDLASLLDEDAKKKFTTIVKSSTKLRTLIDEFMKYSKIGRLYLSKEKFSLGDISNSVLNAISISEKAPDVSITVINKDQLMLGDRNRIAQVFENLIYNAIKYMGAENTNPYIEIGADDNGGKIFYYVKDNGIGIKEENIDRLFNMFFQVVKSADSEGSGVGLAIVKKIIELHGGHIWIESKLGKGTTVKFTI